MRRSHVCSVDTQSGDGKIGKLVGCCVVLVPTFVINLDRSKDRLAHMQGEFTRVGMPFVRLPAVEGANLPDAAKPYFCDASGQIKSVLLPAEIGCYASHIVAWQEVADGTCGDHALVCEDDIVLPDRLPALLQRILRTAPAGWDLIRLCNESTHPTTRVTSLDERHDLVMYWIVPMLAGAYLVSRAGAVKLLRPRVRLHPVDWDLGRPWQFAADSYGVQPAPIRLLDAPSIVDAMGGRAQNLERYPNLLRFSAHKLRRHVYNLRTMGFRAWLSCASAAMGQS